MTATDTSPPFLSEDRSQHVREQVETRLSELSLEEKVGQLTQLPDGFLTGPSFEDVDIEDVAATGRLGSVLNVNSADRRRELQRAAVEESSHGIPLLFGEDVVHGHRTIFPVPLAEAASWDLEAAERSARVAAAEAAADGIHWTFAPMVDVSRDPRWGRVVEGAGEDPFLGASFARARVRGFQGGGPGEADLSAPDAVLACAKHFAGYGAVQAGREYNTVDVSRTELREVHLPPFRAAIDAGLGSIMTAFNVVDRIPATGNGWLLREVLRDEWGFEGFVVTDWDAVGEQLKHGTAADEREAAAEAITAGTDMDMTSNAYGEELATLVRDGVVEERLVDDAVRRVLLLKGALGLLEDPYRYLDGDNRDAERGEQRNEEAADTELPSAHRSVAREVARKSLVLLENDGILPLDRGGGESEEHATVAVVGALADSPEDMLGSWHALGDPDDVVTLRRGIEDAVPDGTTVTYTPGCDRDGAVTADGEEAAIEAVRDSDVAILAVGERGDVTGECKSRANVDVPGQQEELAATLAATGTPVVAVLFNGRPLIVEELRESTNALLEAWFPGVEGGPAIADVLFGDRAPSGRLPMTFPRTGGQIPIHYDQLPTGRPPAEEEWGYTSTYVDVPNEPRYPFGYGLTYTEFAYDDLTLSTDHLTGGEALTATMSVENTGDVSAVEVVQCYLRDPVASRSRPVKQLIDFERLSVAPGERETVTFDVDPASLALWTAEEEWAVEPGEFELMIGRSAADIRLRDEFEYVE